MSDLALESWRTSFENLKQGLSVIAEGLPPDMLPIFPLPQTAIEQLIQLIEQNTFQAASGGSGKSRISILTVYVNPQTAQVIEGTTVVIAKDK